MLASVALTFVSIATILTAVGLAGSYTGRLSGPVEVVVFGAAAVCWSAVALGSFHIEVADPAGGGFLTTTQESLTAFGFGGTLLSVGLMVVAAVEQLPATKLVGGVEGGGFGGRF